MDELENGDVARAAGSTEQLQLDGQTLEEIVQRIAHDHLKRTAPDALAMINELVRLGNSTDEIVEYFAQVSGREEWQFAHVGSAANYIRRLQEIVVVEEVQ